MNEPKSPPTIKVHDPAETVRDSTPNTPKPGWVRTEKNSQFGPFKLIELIGEGGFGSVFEAEQAYPVQRRVALKVIKLGMDTREVIARFETERQVLAMMDHPHVARVFDAGTSSDGRPYFVMERVHGEPITHYCDRHQLSLVERLKLFDQVCQAVQHAHTKGIIHRDLKPNNVLVSTHDERPFAKVIDFGIAKAISGSLSEQTLHTRQQMIGTPLYMSPEQAEGSSDIDTRSDIYALGVLLYELLTGTTPFEPKSLKHAGPAEIQRLIRDLDPALPSSRLSQHKLSRMLRGELDWIVMKALEKERERRYETALALAADVRRYLAGQPVLAAPPSTWYRMRKLIRRNKGAVAAGILLALSLLGGMLSFAWQARIASQRAAELEQVAKFQADMLAQVDPTAAGRLLGNDVAAMYLQTLRKEHVPEAERARQLTAFVRRWQQVNATDAARNLIDHTILNPASAALDRQFQSQPLLDATLRQVLADRYFGIGLYVAARTLQERALATRRRELGDDHPATLASISSLGALLREQGNLAEAEPYTREALERKRRLYGPEHPDTLQSLNNLGVLLQAMGKLAEAEPYLSEALEKRRLVLGEEHPDTLTSISNMGFLLRSQGKPVEAEPYDREALEKRRRVLSEEHPDMLQSITNLGNVLRAQGRLSEAEPLLREALEKRRRILGAQHPSTLRTINSLGVLLQAQGRLREAEPYFREALEQQQRILGPDNMATLASLNSLAGLLQDQGRWPEAERYFRQALTQRQGLLGPEHPATLQSLNNLGYLLQLQGRLSEAEPYLRSALEARRRLRGAQHPDSLESLSNMAGLLQAQGQHAEALALLSSAQSEIRKTFTAANAFRVARMLVVLGRAEAALGQRARAESALREAQQIWLSSPAPAVEEPRAGMQALVDLYRAWHAAEPGKGYDAKANLWQSKLQEPQPGRAIR